MNTPHPMLPLLLTSLLLSLLLKSLAQEQQQITLSISDSPPYLSYYEVVFVITALGDPTVNCVISCPNGQTSSNSGQTLVLMTIPNYNGECTATASAPGYQSAFQQILVQNYTACETGTMSAGAFSTSTSYVSTFSYPNSGPLGYIKLINYNARQLQPTLEASSFRGAMTKGSSAALTFYQSICPDMSVAMNIADDGSYSLSRCVDYNTDKKLSLLQRPFTLFTGFPQMECSESGEVSEWGVQICLAMNQVVLETDSSTFVPTSNLLFDAYFLNPQPGTTSQVLFLLDCQSTSSYDTYEVKSESSAFTIATPDVAPGTVCTFKGSPNEMYLPTSTNTVSLTAVQPLTLSVPSPSVNAGASIAYTIYALAYPSGTPSITMELYCNDALVYSENVSASTSTQHFAVPSEAPAGVCQFNGTSLNSGYLDSNTVLVTVLDPIVTTTSAEITSSTETDITSETTDITTEMTSIASPTETTATTESTEITNVSTTEETTDSTASEVTTEPATTSEAITTTTEEAPTSSEITTTEDSSSISTEVTSTDITTAVISTDITTEVTSTVVTSTTTSVPIVTPTLLLFASPATQTAGGFISYSVSFTPPSIQDAIITLECDPGTGQAIQTQTSSNAQSFQLNAFAMGACNLTASSTQYTSNTVYLTVQQQLYVSSSLDGWTGGQTVALNITSPNLITTSIPYAITCSTSSTSGSVPGSIATVVALSSTLNGVDCLLSSQSTAQYYLNLQPTFVNIAMSAGVIQSVITSIYPSAFVGAVSGAIGGAVGGTGAGTGTGAGNVANDNNQQKRLKLPNHSPK